MTHLYGLPMKADSPLWSCLIKIPAIGKKTALSICKNCSLLPSIRWKYLTERQGATLVLWIDEYIASTRPLGSDLKRKHKNHLETLITLGNYRGLRLRKGLPSRGQNTHSNAKTARKRR